MKIEKRNIKKQLFICTNKRDEGNCCFNREALEVVKILKNRLKSENLWQEFKVTKSGCLGPCQNGVTAALHPDNFFITDIRVGDEEELYQLLIGA